MLSLDEAIKHCEEVAEEQEKLFKRYDDESRYTRNHNKEIVSSNAKKSLECFECAKEHRQLAEWLKKLLAYEEAREEIIRKRDSGQWSEPVMYGFSHAIYIIDKHLKEANVDGCKDCDFSHDGACLCSSLDKWYACPIELSKPENQQALREYAEQVRSKTNGDVIMAMFPDRQPCIGTEMADTDIAVFEREWWNAPYKAKSEEMYNMTCKEINEWAKTFTDEFMKGFEEGMEGEEE